LFVVQIGQCTASASLIVPTGSSNEDPGVRM